MKNNTTFFNFIFFSTLVPNKNQPNNVAKYKTYHKTWITIMFWMKKNNNNRSYKCKLFCLTLQMIGHLQYTTKSHNSVKANDSVIANSSVKVITACGDPFVSMVE